MTLKEYLAQKKTDPGDYGNCVIHQSEWPEIRAWGMRNGYAESHAFSSHEGLFRKGSYNMIQLDDGVRAIFVCEGEPTAPAMLQTATELYSRSIEPLLLNPRKLGVTPPPPDLGF